MKLNLLNGRTDIRLAFFVLLLGGSFAAAPSHGNPLQDTAASMSEGEWREYTSSNWDSRIAEAEPGTPGKSILDFSQRMHWDPIGKQLWMWGKGHGAPVAKLIKFNAESNEWTIMPNPTPFTGTGHAYDEQAIDISGRYLYKKKHSDHPVHRMDLDTGDWESNVFSVGSGDVAQAIEIFPNFQGRDVILSYDSNSGLDELVISSGATRQLYSTGSASKGKDIVNGKNHVFIVYDPANEIVVLGGGNGDSASFSAEHVYKLTKNNVLTELDNIPSALRVGTDGAGQYLGPGVKRGILCPGGNGKLYAHKMIGDDQSHHRLLFELDPNAPSGSQWRQMPNSPLDDTNARVWLVCTLIPEYEVIVFNSWNNRDPRMFLYKPGACDNCPPVDSVAPAAPTGLQITSNN